ncbi:MAG TPA: hypothetical protein VF035_03640 [Longimicrobiales bacterium]
MHSIIRFVTIFSFLPLAACSTAGGIGSAGVPPQLTQEEQISGTRALLIAVSVIDENVVWASGASGTYVRTTNGGATWQAAKVPGADSLQFRDVHAVDANTAYLLSIGNGTDSRIYKTTDAGATWTKQFQNTDPAAFIDCMDFWTPERGIVIGDAVNGQVYMLTTTNGGRTWDRVPAASLPAATPEEGSFAASGTCVETAPGGHAWIVANNPTTARLLHTADYGKTWSVDTLPITTRNGTGTMSIAMRNMREGFALGGGTAQPTDELAALTSDGGKTWELRTRPPLTRGIYGGAYVPGARVTTIVAVGPDGAVYTRDGARTWTAINSNNYWSLGFASPRAGWLVGNAGRITKISGF